MANWARLSVRMRNMEELERAKELGMPPSTVTETFNPIMIDLSEICAYCISYDKNSEETEYSEIALKNGDIMVIGITFDELDKLIRPNGK